MSDATFIPIGGSLSVEQAVDKALSYLYDPNMAVFEIDSDSDWGLIHIKCTRVQNGGWVFALENAKVTDLMKIYTFGEPEYDPPRIVCSSDTPVPETTTGLNNDVTPPLFELYDWNIFNNPEINYTYPAFIETATGQQPLTLKTRMRYTVTIVQEIGTYIIPIAYHRNTAQKTEVLQIARSDASFWPMPKHAVWGKFEKIIGLEASTVLPPPSPPPSPPP